MNSTEIEEVNQCVLIYSTSLLFTCFLIKSVTQLSLLEMCEEVALSC